MILIADTSGLFAALDTDHAGSEVAYACLEAAGLVVVSPMVLAELDHLARRSGRLSGQPKSVGASRARAIVSWVVRQQDKGRISVPEVRPEILGRALTVMNRYESLALDLADAVNVALAAEYDTDAILTLDQRDFRVVRPLGAHQAFRILPAELPVPRG